MRYTNLKKAIITSSIGAIVFVGTAITGAAQNVNAEYRQWQKAQQKAQKEQQDYMRTRRLSDYQQWQRAQQKAQREYLEYQRASARNTGWNNNNRGHYRLYRNGSYYNTDQRGAELLRQAVNRGYAQGYAQGQQAKRYNRGYNYGNESLYRSGTYGYQSYVARDQYQYYYQQGFQRGYEDGYHNTMRYGTRSGNSYSILGSILGTILNITDN